MKFCIDCKYYEARKCKHDEIRDVVTGAPKDCRSARSIGRCGREGKLFTKAADNVFSQLRETNQV